MAYIAIPWVSALIFLRKELIVLLFLDSDFEEMDLYFCYLNLYIAKAEVCLVSELILLEKGFIYSALLEAGSGCPQILSHLKPRHVA